MYIFIYNFSKEIIFIKYFLKGNFVYRLSFAHKFLDILATNVLLDHLEMRLYFQLLFTLLASLTFVNLSFNYIRIIS